MHKDNIIQKIINDCFGAISREKEYEEEIIQSEDEIHELSKEEIIQRVNDLLKDEVVNLSLEKCKLFGKKINLNDFKAQYASDDAGCNVINIYIPESLRFLLKKYFGKNNVYFNLIL